MAAARVKWIEDKTLLGVDAYGKATIMSSSDGSGVSPMQMLLLCDPWQPELIFFQEDMEVDRQVGAMPYLETERLYWR